MRNALIVIAIAGALAYFAAGKSVRHASFQADYIEINRNGYVPPEEASWSIKVSGDEYFIHKIGTIYGENGQKLMFDGKKFYERSRLANATATDLIRVHQYRFWDVTKVKKTQLSEGDVIAGRSTTKYEINRNGKIEHVWLDSEKGVLLQRAYFGSSSERDLDKALEVITCQSISYQSIDPSVFTESYLDT